MMKKYNAETTITVLSASTVLVLAGIAFVLSFYAVRDLAIELGSTPNLAWMYPVIIDGAIIVYSLTVLKKGLHSEKTSLDWTMIGLATAVSIGLNWAHVEYSIGVQTVLAIVPPTVLFFTFHSFMEQVNSYVRRSSLWQSVDDLTVLIGSKKNEYKLDLDQYTKERIKLEKEQEGLRVTLEKERVAIVKLRAERDTLKKEVASLKRQKRQPKTAVNSSLLDYLSSHPKATYTDIMAATGIKSKSTVSSQIKAFTANGELKKNGQGYEVVG
jgi:hypothetical protein